MMKVYVLHQIDTISGVPSIVGIYEKEEHAHNWLANCRKATGDICYYWVTESRLFK